MFQFEIETHQCLRRHWEDASVYSVEIYYVIAISDEGKVFLYTGADPNTDKETVKKMAKSISRTVGKNWEPSPLYWRFLRCVYGSKAYEEMGCEAHVLAQELEGDYGDYIPQDEPPEWY